METTEPTIEEYEDAQLKKMGWCVVCQGFTRSQTEPNAERYDCPKCNRPHTVFGAEQALLLGLIYPE